MLLYFCFFSFSFMMTWSLQKVSFDHHHHLPPPSSLLLRPCTLPSSSSSSYNKSSAAFHRHFATNSPLSYHIMGICFSSTKVSGSNSTNNNNTTTTTDAAANRKQRSSETTTTVVQKQQATTGQRRRSTEDAQKKQKPKEKTGSRRQGGHVPCGKRTDFGYDKDFDKKFSLGKLLGHGQFGYTYVGIDKFNGDRVAVKRLEKNKVCFYLWFTFKIQVFQYLCVLFHGYASI